MKAETQGESGNRAGRSGCLAGNRDERAALANWGKKTWNREPEKDKG